MINKIYKLINNKFYRFFKFVFFIRYLLAIFFVAFVSFISIPHFFDYKKKEKIIKAYLSNNYFLEIIKIENIEYSTLPTPHLIITDVTSKIISEDSYLRSRKLIIYPKFLSIYNYENFHTRKIQIEDSTIEANFENTKIFINQILKLKKGISFKNLDYLIKEKKENILELNKIRFSNYGYKRNIINGEVFDRKFKINFKNKYYDINFKLLDTGITAKLNILKNDQDLLKNGILRGSILKSNFKINFILNEDSIKVVDLFFRDKKLSFDSKGDLKLKPFFKMYFTSEIKNLDGDLFKKIDIEQLLTFSEFIKKLNISHNIKFESKKFSRNIIDSMKIKTKLAYGRLNLEKNFLIFDSDINCNSSVNLLDDYPIIFFNCSIFSPDKKRLFKKIKINYKNKGESLSLNIQGKLNVLNNKINFDNIEMNENYKATNEDLKYFKNVFEKILFNTNFIEIFKLSKIRKLIYEIS